MKTMHFKLLTLAILTFCTNSSRGQIVGDQIGVIQASQIGGTGYDIITTMAKSPIGVFTAGRLTNTADVAYGAAVSTLTGNNADQFICRYDYQGNLIWKKLIGQTSTTEDIYGLATDAASNVYAVGAFTGTCNFDVGGTNTSLTSAGASDIFVAKYTANGVLVQLMRIGSTGNEGATDICIDPAGNIGLMGTFTGTVDFNPGAGVNNQTVGVSPNIFVAKYSSAFALLWVASVGGSNGVEYPGGVACDAVGNLFVSGSISGVTDFDLGAGVVSFPYNGQGDLFVASYRNTDGALRWAKSTGTAGTDEATDLGLDHNGNVFVTGRFGLGSCNFNPNTFPPFTQTNTSPSDDIFLVKYTNSGVCQWTKKLSGGGTNNDMATSISIARDPYSINDVVAIGGKFAGPIDLNPGGTPFVFSDFVGGFVAGYNAQTGAMRLAYKFTPSVSVTDVVIDTFRNVFVVGGFSGTNNFAPYATPGFPLTSFGSTDGFFVRISYDSPPIRLAGSEEEETIETATTEIRLYPNPASETATLDNIPEQAIVSVISLDGRLIREYQSSASTQVQLDLSYVPDGVYFIRVASSNGKAETRKLVVQH